MNTLFLGMICIGLLFVIIFLGLIHMKLCEIHNIIRKYINSKLDEQNKTQIKKVKVSNV
jgi:hypothetical protein